MQKESLEVIQTIKMILVGIYGRFAKAFVLVVVDGLEIVNMHALAISLEFYVQYVKLVEMYATRRLVTIFIKNIGTPIFSEQLVTNFASCFVILAHDSGVVEKLSKVHYKKTKCQDFVTTLRYSTLEI
jgi:hypothetical protein